MRRRVPVRSLKTTGESEQRCQSAYALEAMRDTHSGNAADTVAQFLAAQYHDRMKSIFLVSSDTRQSISSLRRNAELDPRIFKLRAIERWENEGGRFLPLPDGPQERPNQRPRIGASRSTSRDRAT